MNSSTQPPRRPSGSGTPRVQSPPRISPQTQRPLRPVQGSAPRSGAAAASHSQPPRRPLTREEAARRRAYIERKRAERRREKILHTVLALIIGVLILAIVLVAARSCLRTESTSGETGTTRPVVTTEPPETYENHLVLTPPETTAPAREMPVITRPVSTANTVSLTDQIKSGCAVLIAPASGTILAQKNAETRMYPASMTKVMTLLIAYEQIEDLSATFTVTSTIIDPLYRENASLAGFSPNEEVTVLDLMYGTVLPSGAEAAVSLAIYAAGSEEEFVKRMNEKAEELGLTNTHFTNCSGLHNADHYSTAVEIAMILDYTMQYEVCREILSTYQYTTAPTNKHPEGVSMESTMLSRMYGDEPDGVTITAGKTGYTPQAGQCLCSYAADDATGEVFILVTSGAEGKFEPVFDAITVYSDYTP